MDECTAPVSATGTPDLTERDVAILAALVAQPTRAAAAASLGWSERHFRRLLALLIERLAVPGSHAAVAVAARAGLLEP